jgi:anti-sigma factor RsiW
MTENPVLDDTDLHAFIDGELDEARAADVAALVDADPALAARVAAFRSDKDLIARAYGGLIDRPLPQEWIDQVKSGGRVRRSGWQPAGRYMRGIAAMAAALVILLGGWLVYRTAVIPQDEPIVAEALAARDEALVPQTVVSDASPAERNEMLASSLAMNVKAPDLSRMGYRLAAMRVYDGVAGAKAVELSYRDRSDRLFTLYLRHPSSPPRVDLLNRDGMRICIWQDDVIGAVMVGRMSAGEMARLASLAYAGLSL